MTELSTLHSPPTEAECDKCFGGRTTYGGTCICPTGKALYESRVQAWYLKVWDHEAARIPFRFYNASFDGGQLSESQQELLAYHDPLSCPTTDSDDACYELHLSTSRLIWGGYGTGKTYAAVAAAHSYIDAKLGYPTLPGVMFVSTPDLLSRLRDTYNGRGESEADVLKIYREVPLLILDDIGAEHVKDTGWLEDRLYQLINHRHGSLAPTIFTSNLSPAELGKRIGERNMWRIIEMCGDDHIFHVKGKNLRDTKS